VSASTLIRVFPENQTFPLSAEYETPDCFVTEFPHEREKTLVNVSRHVITSRDYPARATFRRETSHFGNRHW